MNNTIKKALVTIPDELRDRIVDEYVKLESRFSRGDWGPSELKGARFAEGVYRYLEWKDSGSYTSLGTQINRSKIDSNVSKNTSLADGIRFQVLKNMDILFDVRNKRDVAHLGEVVDVNEMDSRLVMRLASWSLAEIIREESNLSPEEIQKLIDEISTKSFPIVEEIAGDLVILSTALKADKKALIALYHTYPAPIVDDELFKVVKYSDKSMFKSYVLSRLTDDGLTFRKDGKTYLTEKGIAWIEENIDMELKLN